mmetsp:Transcript_139598/g.348143  ORF Transcript_139598/g.348143 Transcript_139598/m.348143 type:complete len:220 (+) Transcript_139598:131-790(+)
MAAMASFVCWSYSAASSASPMPTSTAVTPATGAGMAAVTEAALAPLPWPSDAPRVCSADAPCLTDSACSPLPASEARSACCPAHLMSVVVPCSSSFLAKTWRCSLTGLTSSKYANVFARLTPSAALNKVLIVACWWRSGSALRASKCSLIPGKSLASSKSSRMRSPLRVTHTVLQVAVSRCLRTISVTRLNSRSRSSSSSRSFFGVISCNSLVRPQSTL